MTSLYISGSEIRCFRKVGIYCSACGTRHDNWSNPMNPLVNSTELVQVRGLNIITSKAEVHFHWLVENKRIVHVNVTFLIWKQGIRLQKYVRRVWVEIGNLYYYINPYYYLKKCKWWYQHHWHNFISGFG